MGSLEDKNILFNLTPQKCPLSLLYNSKTFSITLGSTNQKQFQIKNTNLGVDWFGQLDYMREELVWGVGDEWGFQ